MEKNQGSISDSRVSRNYAIDALRFIAVCLVIYIHIFEINYGFKFVPGPTWAVVDIVFGIARLAVPLFFAISGWYIFSKNRDEVIKKLQKQLPKLLLILLWATLGTCFLIFILASLHLSDLSFLPKMRNIFEMFLFGQTPNAVGPLWFLVSLIIVEGLFLIAIRTFKSINWFAFIAAVTFLLLILFTSYRTLTGLPEFTAFEVKNSWVVGFIWFTLGYFLAKYFKENQQKIKSKTLVYFVVLTGLFYLYEYIMHTSGSPFNFGPYNYSVAFLFTPIITAGILLLAGLSNYASKPVRALAYLGKNYSLGVFIVHIVLMQPVDIFFSRLGLLTDYATLRVIATYTTVVVASFLVTAAYYYVKSKLGRYQLKIISKDA